jgi:DNA-binding protein H-NS
MEADNEAIEPTRSLFGGPVVPTTTPDAEDSTVATDTVDTESAEIEQIDPKENTAVNTPTMVEEAVTDESEQVQSEPQEAEPIVEVPDEIAKPTDVDFDEQQHLAHVEATGNDTAVASTEVMEDTTLSATDTLNAEVQTETPVAEAEAEPEKELPEIAKLKAEREKLDEAIQSKQLEERKSVISQIAAVVKLYDIPLLDLFKSLGGVPNPRKGEKAPITHKDDQGNTWTGRGRTPRWLKDKNPDDYRV